MDKNRKILNSAAVFAAGVGLLYVIHNRRLILHKLRNFRNPLGHRVIEIVDTVDDCHRVVNVLKKHCNAYAVLGFDCEWVTVGGTRRPVALLQLSSHEGLCALFRLCNMQQIPKSLRELLEDDDVIKVGVAPHEDAQKLCHDYGVGVASTLDLRFLAAVSGVKGGGLAKMSKSFLNVHLDKNWRLACSDWESRDLNEKQLHYAANDALVSIEIFKKLINKLEPRHFWDFGNVDTTRVRHRLEVFFDVKFRESLVSNLSADKNANGLNNGVHVSVQKSKNWQPKKTQTRKMTTRAKALYDNCLLEAPDGDLLCTIDRRKAAWYLDQNLGDQVNAEPFTVRLNFEPAGRAVGEVGRYYQSPKENQCVVCGTRDAYIRKHVVPREYRKYFPVDMKSHTSHDILLLCPSCHQLSNISDYKVRQKLALQCEAPFTHEDGVVKVIEVSELKQLRSAARALLHQGEKIPAERRNELKQVILNHYGNEKELTQELLEEAASTESTVVNANYCHHGEKVVQRYQSDFGGIIELEKLWREHFLHTMKPAFLPHLWNVNHNANRLETREGRVGRQELIPDVRDALPSLQKSNPAES